MMKFHKPGRLRMLGGAAAIATLGGLSLAFGSAGAWPTRIRRRRRHRPRPTRRGTAPSVTRNG